MLRSKIQKFLILLLLTLFQAYYSPDTFSEEPKSKEIFVGKAVSQAAQKAEVTITITRWSTDAERDQLLGILLKNGTNKMVDALEDQKETGFIRVEDSLGYRLRYARETREAGKRRITLATNRPMSFGEQARGGRSQDYRLSLIELLLDEQGNGEGTIAPAVKLKVNQKDNTLEVETYSYDPVQIESIQKKE